LLDDDDAAMEIEFSSPTEGKIFCGGQEFAVKFAESQPTEVYRRLPHNAPNAPADGADYELLGVAHRRFHVISSLDAVTQDLRRKARNDLVEKEKHQTIPLPLDDAEAAGHDAAALGGTGGGRRKRPSGTLSLEALPLPSPSTSPSKSTRGAAAAAGFAKKPFAVAIEVPSTWVVVRDLPAAVTAADVRDFFGGLHVKGVYVFYASPGAGAGAGGGVGGGGTADVYVDFETKAGAEQAAARSGERMTFRADPRRRSAGKGAQPRTSSGGPVAADVRTVALKEASWAKALGIRLEDTAARCEEALAAVRRHLPETLQGLRPAAAAARWDAVFGGSHGAPLPLPDEIVTYHEHQVMRSSSSHVYRHDYSAVGGFFDPPVSFAWAGGYGMHLSVAARPPGAVRPPAPAYGALGPLHGDVALHAAYAEVEDTLGQLAAVLCGAMAAAAAVAAAGTAAAAGAGAGTEKGSAEAEAAEAEQRAQLVVCDSVHRMVGIYQHVHHELMRRRFV
jgi:hypothetical protein